MYRIPYENEQITKTIAAPYAPVDFTEEEKEQFRENIGAEQAGRYSNPNLLDNPFFRIHQRGTTSGNGSYIADRWVTTYGNGGVTWSRTDTSITVQSTSGDSHGDFYQKLETSLNDFLTGKTVTASVMLADGSIRSATWDWHGSGGYYTNSMGNGLDGNRITVREDNGVVGSSAIQFWKNSTPETYLAAKLELGEKSTLENDVPPDYATELLKCQRYFFRVSAITAFAQLAESAGGAGVFIQIPIKMRATPTFSYINKGTMIVGGNLYTPTSVSLSSALENTITLSLTGDWTLTRQPAIWANDSALNFSADL